MSEPAVIEGILAGYRSTVDGGMTLSIHLDEFAAARFHQIFTGVNLPVAIARLNTEETESD